MACVARFVCLARWKEGVRWHCLARFVCFTPWMEGVRWHCVARFVCFTRWEEAGLVLQGLFSSLAGRKASKSLFYRICLLRLLEGRRQVAGSDDVAD